MRNSGIALSLVILTQKLLSQLKSDAYITPKQVKAKRDGNKKPSKL